MRGRAQSMLEDRDNIIEQLEAQLRTLGQQPARPAGASSGGTSAHLGPRAAAGAYAGRAGLGGAAGSTAWGSAVSSTAVSPSPPGPGLAFAGGSGPHGALAGTSSVGLASPAFSGKFSGSLLASGSPKGSPHAHAGVQQLIATSRGHSRSSSVQMQHGLSLLSGNRRASDGAEALGAVGEAAAGAAGSLASKRSSSSGALQQAAAEPEAAADALPLSTLRLDSQGSGVPVSGGGIAGGRLQLLPLPGTTTPTAAAASSSPDLASTAEELEELPPEDLRIRVLSAEGEVREWRAAIESANARITELYDETHHLRSLYDITERDAKYLREVIVSAFKGGELHASPPMLQGLQRMLHFTPQEMEKIQAHSKSHSTGGVVSSLTGWGLPNFGGLTSPLPSSGSRLF